MKYIERTAEKKLKEILSSGKVAMILGARQVGKTTLIEHVLRNHKTVFLNLDIETDKQRLLAAATLAPLSAMKSFGNPDFLVIDEAQRVPESGRIVKGWYDADVKTKIILLGSSSLNLLSQSAESLTGRNLKLLLPPFLFREVITTEPWYSKEFGDKTLSKEFSNQLRSLLMTSLVFGSYPEAVTSSAKQEYLLNLVSDYLLKDILQLGLVKTPNLIHRLLSLLAHQAGSEISINELANSLGTTRPTIERYLELLEQTFVIFRLKSFSTNPRKEIAKSQKIFFWDNGIRNALLNEFSENPLRPDIGRLFENWVISEFAKDNLLAGQRQNLYFWRSRRGPEIDLIIKDGEKLRAIEIKWKKQRVVRKAFVARYEVNVEVIDSTKPLIRL